MNREQMIDDLEATLGPDALLGLSDDEWRAKTDEAVPRHQEYADLLRSIDLVHVHQYSLALRLRYLRRRVRALPPRGMAEQQERIVRDLLAVRDEADRLAEVVRATIERETEQTMSEPPGGRDLWPGLRRREARRLGSVVVPEGVRPRGG